MVWLALTNLATEFDLHLKISKCSPGGSSSRETHCQLCIVSERLCKNQKEVVVS